MTTRVQSRIKSKSQSYAFLLMIVSAACWGIATVMSKEALNYAPPMTLLVLELFASIIFLTVILMIKRIRMPFKLITDKAALIGVFEPGLAYALIIAGLQITSASNASMIGATEPIIVVILAMFLLKARIKKIEILAIMIAIAGVMLASLSSDTSTDNSSITGDSLVVLATVFSALYAVLSSQIVTKLNPLVLALAQQIVGFIFSIILAAIFTKIGLETFDWHIPLHIWFLIFATGIIGYSLAFWLYLSALKHIPVHIAAMILSLIPVFGVGSAVLLLNESVTAAQLFGCILIISSIFAVAQRKS